MISARIAAAWCAALLFPAATLSAQVVDPTLLNMREHGGTVIGVSASSRNLDTDDPTEALGNPTGPVEPGTFIFADNGPGGTETMLFHGTAVTLAGVRITGGGAGPGAADPRSISTVLVYGGLGLGPDIQLASLADFNDQRGFEDLLFEQPFRVDHLGIQFGTPEQGARVSEIDAIVPEPASLSLTGAGALALLRRRTRRLPSWR